MLKLRGISDIVPDHLIGLRDLTSVALYENLGVDELDQLYPLTTSITKLYVKERKATELVIMSNFFLH